MMHCLAVTAPIIWREVFIVPVLALLGIIYLLPLARRRRAIVLGMVIFVVPGLVAFQALPRGFRSIESWIDEVLPNAYEVIAFSVCLIVFSGLVLFVQYLVRRSSREVVESSITKQPTRFSHRFFWIVVSLCPIWLFVDLIKLDGLAWGLVSPTIELQKVGIKSPVHVIDAPVSWIRDGQTRRRLEDVYRDIESLKAQLWARNTQGDGGPFEILRREECLARLQVVVPFVRSRYAQTLGESERWTVRDVILIDNRFAIFQLSDRGVFVLDLDEKSLHRVAQDERPSVVRKTLTDESSG